MGCSIHFHTEVKVNGRWEHFSNPEFPQSYEMFSLMAGVRKRENEMWIPFKLHSNCSVPHDLNVITRKSLLEDSDIHSVCHYRAIEIKEFYEYIEENKILIYSRVSRTIDSLDLFLERDFVGYFCGNSWLIQPHWVDDYRWIFGFDN